jgi:hypothetical protein
MEMTGQQIKERLERDLGFEANRARMLAEAAASEEIATYWRGRKLDVVDAKAFAVLAKSALVAGLAGRQKLTEQLFKLISTPPKDMQIVDIAIEINALVLDHQKTLNLSRHRASCVNAHLNVLEPERALVQTYSGYLVESELKNAQKTSNALLKRKIFSSSDFLGWIKDVHALLSSVSADSQDKSSEELSDDFEEGTSKKGLISRKAISTYLKQWELFAKEKLGPNFSLVIEEEDASPLSGKLNRLENGSNRTWTTMIIDITEARTSSVFQKRSSDVVNRITRRTLAQRGNVDNFDLELSGRPLKIQLSNKGVTEELVSQFVKAMKAQFLIYSGKGMFNVSLQGSGCLVTVSVPDAKKPDLKKVEEVILALL